MLPTYYCYNYQAPVALLVSHVRPSVFFLTNSCLPSAPGYGFVDFDSPAAAQKAVSSLKATGVQAQMAKVREHFKEVSVSPSCYIISRSVMHIELPPAV